MLNLQTRIHEFQRPMCGTEADRQALAPVGHVEQRDVLTTEVVVNHRSGLTRGELLMQVETLATNDEATIRAIERDLRPDIVGKLIRVAARH